MARITQTLWNVYIRLRGMRPVTFGLMLGLIVAAGGFFYFLGTEAPTTADEQYVRHVELRSIAELGEGGALLSIAGTVEAASEAEVRAEKSGQVVRVNRTLGDRVVAGTVIVEIENASERAVLLQAQGTYDAARANLAKVEKGTREQQLSILQSAETSAKAGAVNTLLNAYAATENAIRGTTDKMFSNPDGYSPHFNVNSAESQAVIDIETKRVQLASILDREARMATTISSSSNLDTELSTMEIELRAIRDFLDRTLVALNAGIASQSISDATIATYKSDVAGARTSITSSLSGIASARQALETAQKNLEQGVEGPQIEDVAAAKASVTQAEGSLAAARAALEKSYVRAPISGSINRLSLKRGEHVVMQNPILLIADNDALEVIAHVTEQDARELTPGTRVSIDAESHGVITKIAPALDSTTKKIEIRVGVTDGVDRLFNGQSVSISFERAEHARANARLTIPLSALKLTADSNLVFTVNENRLVPHEVELGVLLGERVEVLSGVTPDMKIVVDARGLQPGELIIVQ